MELLFPSGTPTTITSTKPHKTLSITNERAKQFALSVPRYLWHKHTYNKYLWHEHILNIFCLLAQTQYFHIAQKSCPEAE